MSMVLIVEDDSAILRGLRDSLRFERYDVLTANDGEEGYRLAAEKKPDLVILDLMLPGMSGFEILRKLRAEGFKAPVLMLTARGEESDRVLGLDLGADDYVTKPFSIREVLARVRALMRRVEKPADELPGELRFDDVTIDFRRFEAVKGNASVDLTRKEFALLRMLAANVGSPLTRDELLDGVWGYESYPHTRTVDTHGAGPRAKV